MAFLIRLTEGEYEEVADETLESLADKFDALVEDGLTLQDYDVQLAVGEVTGPMLVKVISWEIFRVFLFLTKMKMHLPI